MDLFVSDIISIVFIIVGLVFLLKNEVNLTLSAGRSGSESFVETAHWSKPIKLRGSNLKIIGLIILATSIFCLVYIDSGNFIGTI